MTDVTSAPRIFLILTHERSGSTRLVRILDQHPEIVCAGEIFTRSLLITRNQPVEVIGCRYDPEQHAPMAFLRTCATAYAHRDGKGLFGCKIFRHQVAEEEQVRWIEDPCIPKILLWRENLLEAVISREIAMQTGIYNIPANAALLELLQPVRLDCERMEHWMMHTRRWMDLCRKLIGQTRQAAAQCTYETFSGQALAAICEHLGMQSSFAWSEPFQKITRPAVHYQWIENIVEVRERFGDGTFGVLPEAAAIATITATR
jgi:LPS sulfotransferase NodH